MLVILRRYKRVVGGGAFLVLLIGQRLVAQRLSPPPDSLRPVLAGAAGEARVRGLLRVAAAFTEELNPATEAYAQAAERQARALGDPVLEGQALVTRGTYYLFLDDAVRAGQVLRQATPLLRAAPLPVQAGLAYQLGMLADLEGRLMRALASYRRAYALYRRAGNRAQCAEVLNSTGIAFLRRDRLDSAATYLLAALRQHHQLGRPLAEASALNNLAAVAQGQNQTAAAIRYMRQAYALQAHAGDSVGMAESLSGLASLLSETDSIPTALPIGQQSYRLTRRLHLTELLPTREMTLALLWQKLRRPDSAEVYYRRAVVGSEQVTGQDAGRIMGRLAEFYLSQNRLAEAESYANKVLALNDVAQWGVYSELLALKVLREVAARRGDYRRAYELAQQSADRTIADERQRGDRTAHELRVQYETDQAEQQVRLLKQNSKLMAQRRELAELRARQQRLVFGVVGGLLLAAVGWATYYFRRRQRTREAQLRTRLAADLHDDVGGLLTQIAVESALLRETSFSPEQQRQRLERVVQTSQNAMRQMSDVVWSIGPSHDSLADLLDRLRDHAYEVLTPAGLEIDFHTELGLATLDLELSARQNLYLIFKEALHNVVKHAHGATQVTIRLTHEGRWLRLAVYDDGAGYPALRTGAEPGRVGGNGLTNMRRRAAESGGDVTYEPSPDGGFGVVARVGL